ncbi:MAG: methyltransferase domain-containing protein [Caldilineaceae bacterium]
MEFVRLCPVCGQQCTDILFRPAASPGPVVQCRHCSMVYIATIEDHRALIFDGPVTAGYQDLKVLTSSNLAEVTNSWEFKLLPDKEDEWPALRQNALDALQYIAGHCSQPYAERNLLDLAPVGAFSSGRQRTRLDALWPRTATRFRRLRQATFGLTIVTDTLSESTFPPDCFDVITAFQVFEHLPYPQENLQHLHKMLRPDGIVLIEVPNFATWTMRTDGFTSSPFCAGTILIFSLLKR